MSRCIPATPEFHRCSTVPYDPRHVPGGHLALLDRSGLLRPVARGGDRRDHRLPREGRVAQVPEDSPVASSGGRSCRLGPRPADPGPRPAPARRGGGGGGGGGGGEPFAESYHYASLEPDFTELTAEAEELVYDATGL